MTAQPLDRIAISSPATFVASLPYMVGFTPDESVVACWIKDDRVLVTQRADLMDSLMQPAAFTAPALRHQPDRVILAFYHHGGPDDPQHYDDRVEAFYSYVQADLEVVDALWVDGDTYGSLICNDPECGPPEGRKIDPSLAAEFVLAGSAPASHRETLTTEAKPTGTARRIERPADSDIEVWRDESIALALDVYWEGRWSDSDLIALGSALFDVRVRDTLLWEATQVDRESLRVVYEYACTVARAMHPEDAAPACSVAAIVAWVMGDGARANIAVGYALEADPDYSLARLVDVSLRSGLPPQAWADSMRALTYKDCRHGA